MNPKQTVPLRVFIQIVLFVVVIPFLPLIISGQWGWWEAWVFAGISVLGFAISRGLAARRHPDLIAERAQFLRQPDGKSWDRILVPLVGLGGSLIPLIAGVDALLSWPPSFGLPLKMTALLVFLGGYGLGSYALIENRFFSGVVRLQTDRGHQVVSSGPYRWMRHPGYAGALISYLATPVWLDSLWAFLPMILLAVVLAVRTHLEDQTLQKELAGYRDYARQVRYRLLPGIW